MSIKHGIRLAFIIYWVLLAYVVAALLWWFISLWQQNDQLYHLRLTLINIEYFDKSSPGYLSTLQKVEIDRNRKITKFIGEGFTFFLLIQVGAFFIYRYVQRHLKIQQQQENFSMAVTHELKTPIAIAQLNIETILKHNLEKEQKTKLLKASCDELNRLTDLVNNILLSAQFEGKKFLKTMYPINFSESIQEKLNDLQNRYPEIIINKDIQPNVEIVGDDLLIKMMLNNLLDNAIKYSYQEKEFLVELKEKDKAIILQIADKGIGIAESEKKNIFKKFYRVGNESTRKTSGSGLGLYICKRIADIHNATINIKNNTPKGSIFEIIFPAIKNE